MNKFLTRALILFGISFLIFVIYSINPAYAGSCSIGSCTWCSSSCASYGGDGWCDCTSSGGQCSIGTGSACDCDKECASGDCSGGVCVSGGPSCSAGWKCYSSSYRGYQYSDCSWYSTLTYCDYGCSGGSCESPSCSAGWKCYSSSYRGYQYSDCSWYGGGTYEYCPEGCSGGSCNVPTCSETYFCSGDYRYYRSFDCSESYIESCSYGCSGGYCNNCDYYSSPDGCTSSQYCYSGSCTSCSSGYANCDRTYGCEKNLNTDENNCGSCGNVCSSGETCSSGSCVCAPDASFSCYSNDVWSYDSCGSRKYKYEECNHGNRYVSPEEYRCSVAGDVERKAYRQDCIDDTTDYCGVEFEYWNDWADCTASQFCNFVTGTCDATQKAVDADVKFPTCLKAGASTTETSWSVNDDCWSSGQESCKSGLNGCMCGCITLETDHEGVYSTSNKWSIPRGNWKITATMNNINSFAKSHGMECLGADDSMAHVIDATLALNLDRILVGSSTSSSGAWAKGDGTQTDSRVMSQITITKEVTCSNTKCDLDIRRKFSYQGFAHRQGAFGFCFPLFGGGDYHYGQVTADVDVTLSVVEDDCTPSWGCTAWSPSTSLYTCATSVSQTRTCTDSNSCGTTAGKPSESQTGTGEWCSRTVGKQCRYIPTCDAYYYGYSCTASGCDDGPYWRDDTSDDSSCDDEVCAIGKHCESGSCVSDCTPNSYVACFDNDLYNYNSCDVIGTKQEECGDGYFWKSPTEYQCDVNGDVDRRAYRQDCIGAEYGAYCGVEFEYWNDLEDCTASQFCNSVTGECDDDTGGYTCDSFQINPCRNDNGCPPDGWCWSPAGPGDLGYGNPECASFYYVDWSCYFGVCSWDTTWTSCNPLAFDTTVCTESSRWGDYDTNTPCVDAPSCGTTCEVDCSYGPDAQCDEKTPDQYQLEYEEEYEEIITQTTQTRLDWCDSDCGYNTQTCNEITECNTDPGELGVPWWCVYWYGQYYWAAKLSTEAWQCTDDHDNDCDTFKDCADFDCAYHPDCCPSGEDTDCLPLKHCSPEKKCVDCVEDDDCANNPKGNKCLDDNVCGCSDEDDCAWSGGTSDTFCPNDPRDTPDHTLPTCKLSKCKCDQICGVDNSKCVSGYCCTGAEPGDPNPKCEPITTILDPWLCT